MLGALALIETTLDNSVMLYFPNPPPTKHPPNLYKITIEMFHFTARKHGKGDSVCYDNILLSVVLPDCITQIPADRFWLSDNFWAVWGGTGV